MNWEVWDICTTWSMVWSQYQGSDLWLPKGLLRLPKGLPKELPKGLPKGLEDTVKSFNWVGRPGER